MNINNSVNNSNNNNGSSNVSSTATNRLGSEEKTPLTYIRQDTPPRQPRVIEIPVQHIKTSPSSSSSSTTHTTHPHPHSHHNFPFTHNQPSSKPPGHTSLFGETSPFSADFGPPPTGLFDDSDFFDRFDKNFDIDSPLSRRRRLNHQQQHQQHPTVNHHYYQPSSEPRFPFSNRFGGDDFFNRSTAAPKPTPYFQTYIDPLQEQQQQQQQREATPVITATRSSKSPTPATGAGAGAGDGSSSFPRVYKTQATIFPEQPPPQPSTTSSGVPIRVEHIGSDFKYPEPERQKIPVKIHDEGSQQQYPNKMGNTMANNSPNTSTHINNATTPNQNSNTTGATRASTPQRRQHPNQHQHSPEYTNSDFASAAQQQQQQQQQQQPSAPAQKTAQQKCEDIDTELNKLEHDVEAFAGQKDDKVFMKLEEMLTRCLLRLDEIDRGDDKINQMRKKLINLTHRLSDRLHEVATRNATALVLVEPPGELVAAPPEPKRSKSPSSSGTNSPADNNTTTTTTTTAAMGTKAKSVTPPQQDQSAKSTPPNASVSNLINQFETKSSSPKQSTSSSS